MLREIRIMVVSTVEGGWSRQVHRGNIWGARNILYLNRGIGYISICNCQNFPNCAIKIYGFHCIHM